MIGSKEEEFLQNWYAVIRANDAKFKKFMGDKDSTPGHNRRMLTYFAGSAMPPQIAAPPVPNETIDRNGTTSDRERLIALFTWQLQDHMDNTERADLQEKRDRIVFSAAFAIAAFSDFLLAATQTKLAGVILALVAGISLAIVSAIFLFRWRIRKPQPVDSDRFPV